MELDTKKYELYQTALEEAYDKFPENTKVIICYIGVGTGRMLSNIFDSAKNKNREIFVYAVEKNPFAIQSAKDRIAPYDWKNKVQIIRSDIKDFVPP